LEGVFTHFARADETDLGPSLEQLSIFRSLLRQARARGVDPGLVHAAQSAGLLAGGPLDAALPEAGAVRVGLLLYGVRPAAHLGAGLAPAMTLSARVAHVRRLRGGDAVGYAALWRAPGETRIATLALGYADGLPIAASNRGQVWLRGRRLPLVGRVSMDYVAVEIGDAPVEIGDEAVVFGVAEGGGIPVEDAAAAAQTLPYELLVRLGARVPRVHV
jgi:alanine racemase